MLNRCIIAKKKTIELTNLEKKIIILYSYILSIFIYVLPLKKKKGRSI